MGAVLAIAVVLALTGALVTRERASAGELTGDLPADGGLAYVANALPNDLGAFAVTLQYSDSGRIKA